MKNKTEIFADYSAFFSRPDKDVNGVTAEFAADHPGYARDNATNMACWRCSGCSDCSGCSRCSGCSDCSDCSGCSRCSGCSDCLRCSRCSDCSNIAWLDSRQSLSPTAAAPGAERDNVLANPPIIPGIHAKLLEAVAKPDALNMETWHTCDTMHCRGGWIVTLAGERGRALEAQTDTLFAAMMIYKASSPIRVSPVRFYEKNDVAMADIRRCAAEEAALAK